MLFAGVGGELEIRRSGGGMSLRGSFPYNKLAVLSDGGRRGRPRKERVGSRAFRYSIENAEQEIHLLVGHDFGQPLASKLSGSLSLEDTRSALLFEATLSDEVLGTSHAKDAMALLSAGLVGGISPGFRIPPERTVPNAETIEEEDPSEGTAIIRTINEAVLYEISVVTRPAYDQTEVQIEGRNWTVTAPAAVNHNMARYRWRL